MTSRFRDRSMEWHSAAKRYLDRLCVSEYAAQKRAAKGRSFRYSPSDYVRDLISCLDNNDEEGFKAIKMRSGYASTLGV